MMAVLDHSNLIQLFQVIETFHYFCMIMGHAGGGQLRDFIPSGGIQEDKAHRLFRQIVRAMQFCHKEGIAHLDLKLENIMVDDSGNVKLIDFGLSTRFTAGEKLKEIWGTCLYFSPELTQEEEYESPPTDIWSLGIILHFMLTGRCPFRAASREQLKKLITQGAYDILPHVFEGAQRLINEILMVGPTIEQVMGHPWLSQGEVAASPSPSSDTLPKLPDPTIMKTIINMGHHPYNTWVSVTS
ncbi:hypothetical protein GHT09_018637 [Marmota monax]|uniref:non-specific serine/threonine protein kinase n=1 Tax=Marmota monax TaxID=9995 RepID=A0A834Q3P7_MARMO|nr:hypothetical protein GHT09_018637 [Marmota monax]